MGPVYRLTHLIASCIVSGLMFTASAGAVEISLSSQTSAPGSSLAIPLMLGTQGTTLSGIQFDLRYDSSVMSISAIPGDSARKAFKDIYTADISDNVRRFIVIGNNQNTISDGILLTLYVNLRPGTATGSYELSLASTAAPPIAVDSDGGAIDVSALSGYIAVQGTDSGSVPLSASGVLNAASLLPGPVAPGEFITLFGSGIGPSTALSQDQPGSVDLGEVRVLFDDIPAPLLYAASGQINAIVPYAVTDRSNTRLQVAWGGQVRGEVTLPVTATAPAIFTVTSTGTGQAAALNQDYSVNSALQPAARGDIIMLYANGGGNTTPEGKDGAILSEPLPVLQLPVSVLIGATPAEVLYSGPAPGFLSGFIQINCRIPTNLPAGAIPVSIQIGSQRSQDGVTVAVR